MPVIMTRPITWFTASKGVAGNLAAGGLQAAAMGLEKLVKHATRTLRRHRKACTRPWLPFVSIWKRRSSASISLEPAAGEPDRAPSLESVGRLPSALAKEAAGRLRRCGRHGRCVQLALIAEEFLGAPRNLPPIKQELPNW